MASAYRNYLIALLTCLLLAGPQSRADTFYSNLQDTTIPDTFSGVDVDVNGGGVDLNAFFGGIGLANSPSLQPVRFSTGDLSRILNLASGSLVNNTLTFATNNDYGGSQDHLALTGVDPTKFVVDTEGYIGFRLNGVGFGWMRVVFGGGTGNARIKDWAYENTGSGGSIVIGRVHQSAPVSSAQTVTLSPGAGENFNLASVISDTGGNVNSVVKTGAGTTVLTANNTHTGLTDVQAGTLELNRAGGAIADTSAVQVSGGTLTVTQNDTVSAVTLSSGSISGSATLSGSSYSLTNSGHISVNLGNTAATLTKTGAGTATLSGNANHTGDTNINAGVLLVDGDINSSNVFVAANATLAGSGIIDKDVTLANNGIISPGNGTPSTLRVGGLTTSGTGNFMFQISGLSAGSQHDQIIVDNSNGGTGVLDLGAAILNITVGYTPAVNDSFLLVNNLGAGSVLGNFFNGATQLNQGDSFTQGGQNYVINYNGGNGNDVVISAIPEPGVSLLCGIGMLALLRRRRV